MRVPYAPIKRALDVALAGAGLLVTLPLQFGIAIGVRRLLGTPVLFRQQRPGLSGEPFILIKFRTMKEPDPIRGIVSDEDRMTQFGSILRSTSLDELPTLWNVLRGDMSIVGPRPLLMDYLPHYTPDQACRHDVRPGITGLAQVSGRNATTWTERLAADADYVERLSLRLDAEIVARTVRTVVRREGITAEGYATMPRFDAQESQRAAL